MKQKKITLKNKLVSLVVVGYALPVGLVLVLLGQLVSHQMNAQIQETVELSLRETTELAGNYVESLMEDSRRASYDGTLKTAWLTYLSDGNQASLYQISQNYLNNAYKFNDTIHTGGFFYQIEGLTPQYVCSEPHRITQVQKEYEALLPKFREIGREIDTGLYFYAHDDRLYLIRNVVNSDFQPYGLLVLEVNTERILGAFQGIGGVRQVELNFDQTAKLFWETNWVGEDPLTLLQREKKVGGLTLEVSLWVDTNQGREELRQFSGYLMWSLLLIFPAVYYLLKNFTQHITLPIQRLLEGTRRIQEGELGYQVEELAQSTEFEAITQGFNAMSHRLKTHLEESIQEQIALQDAKIKTLQSQINPHFLNNTLEIINWEVRMAGNDSAGKMIESLSVMLSATMDRRGRPKIPLSAELTYVDAYLYIQSCRMGKRLTVERNISPETLEYLVPKLAYQPIVENAFEHGIANLKQGVVELSTYIYQDKLYFEVKNNGTLSPKDQERIAQLLSWDNDTQNYTMDSTSLGIRNVNQRVKMMYGSEFGLELFNQEQGHTIARLAIPLEPGETL